MRSLVLKYTAQKDLCNTFCIILRLILLLSVIQTLISFNKNAGKALGQADADVCCGPRTWTSPWIIPNILTCVFEAQSTEMNRLTTHFFWLYLRLS